MNSPSPNFFPIKRLLVPTDRVANRPLGSWAKTLLVELGQRALTVEDWKARGRCLGVILNQSALINFHLGQPILAERLCCLQLSWLSEAFREKRDVQFLALAFQPWVNLRRIQRATGKLALAEESLTRALSMANDGFNPLMEFEIAQRELRELCELNPTYKSDVSRICFRELLLTRLEAGNYLEALNLLMDNALATHIPSISVMDGMALVLCLLRSPSYALEMLRNMQENDVLQNELILLVRTLEGLLTLGAHQDAELLATELIESVSGGLSENLVPSEVDLYCHVALLLEHSGYPGPGSLLASNCFASFAGLDDELGAFCAAQIAHRCASESEEKSHWSIRLKEFATKSSYHRIRNALDSDGSPGPQADIHNVERLNQALLRPR